ncbi:MAG: L,D-transpeptidase family protein [Pseudomonadota bacterium]
MPGPTLTTKTAHLRESLRVSHCDILSDCQSVCSRYYWRNFPGRRTALKAYFCLLWITATLLLSPQSKALTFDLPPEGEHIIGEMLQVIASHEDTLPAIAMAHGIGYREIVAANPDLNPWLPGEGTVVHVPTRFILPPGERKGMILNLPELRLYYYPPGGEKVITYAIGIGREGWNTPEGAMKIVAAIKNPKWIPPQSIIDEYAEEGIKLERVVPPGPDNPLGNYKLPLSLPGYLLHGTNKPLGVGMRVSHGCIRLYPDDIEELYKMDPVGIKVKIIKLPYKAGWSGGRLFLEAHKPLSEEFNETGLDLTAMVATIIRAHEGFDAAINWDLAETSARRHHGLPVAITAPVELTNPPSRAASNTAEAN